uniref:Tankyrase 1 binding protein 1 n=1 Tax=Salvator merianae TaxID=96440 RepID=A0A8D0BXH1_SALMN
MGAVIYAESVSPPGDVMDSNAQCSPLPCMAANGQREPKQSSSSLESGNVRPKPPVKPKPCVLPKPAMPTTLRQVPGLRQPSAEKINLLAGPKPYNSGAGNAVKRLSFTLKSPPREATNGKEVSSPLLPAVKPSGDVEVVGSAKKPTAVESAMREECGESHAKRKGTVPFKVKPVPVAAKPERFPGTTVEEILAKMEKPNKEGPNNPDRPRLVHSSFSQDGSAAVHLGPKGYVAFRRCSSGGEVESGIPACRVSCEVQESKLTRSKEETATSDSQSVLESEQPTKAMEKSLDFLSRDSSSSQPSVSCDGSHPGHSSPLSPPGVSLSLTSQPLFQLSSGVTPGSPDVPAEPALSPGAPGYPADVPSTETELPPGSPDVLTEVPKSSVEVCLGLVPAPGSPVAREDPCPPGSPLEHFLASDLSGLSARDPEICLLPESSASLIHSPAEPLNYLQGISESPGSPSMHSEYSISSDQPPGSPSHAYDSLRSRDEVGPRNQVQTFPLEDKKPLLSKLALRRASEGVVQAQSKNMVKEELGGSLAALPSGAGAPLEHVVEGDSKWSLSQSFEWSFPSQTLEFGGKRSPSQSPIKEADDNGLLEMELCGKSPGPKDSYEQRDSEDQNIVEEPEVLRSFPFLSDSRDSQMCGEKAEAQQESTSSLEMSAPGGPSVQREPTGPMLKGPIMAAEGDFQEEHDKCLTFVSTQEEGALQAIEPLPSVQELAPPTEPCILFSEDAQIQKAAVCQEEDCALDLAQKREIGDAELLTGREPEPGSQWLDELLASPPPSADDTKRRSTPKPEDPTGQEDLLGWSRKDLSSEFGIVGAEQSASFDIGWAGTISKGDWPGKTEQDREFGTSAQDWLTSYRVSDAKKQDMEFGTSQQGWARGTPLQDNSNPGQEDWFIAYGSSCADQQIKEHWSHTYDISTADGQDKEPYMRKPGWPKLCSSGDDQESSEVAPENMSWNSQYHIGALERTDWTNEYSLENSSCPELGTELSDESNRYNIDSHQDTELTVRHSERSDDHHVISVASQDATFSANQSGWPSELTSNKNAIQLESEFTACPKEQHSAYEASHQESQVSTQEQLPRTYIFNADNSQESEMNAKQPDWPARYDTGVVQCQDDEFTTEKPDMTSEYEDNRIVWERELDATKFEEVDPEFCARKQVWADKYSLGETDPQDSNFTAGTMEWIRDTDISGVEEKEQSGDIKENHAGSLGPLGLLRVTVGSEVTSPIITGQPEDVSSVVLDEPRGTIEGQSEWTQDLSLTDVALSSGLQLGNPDTSEDSTKKHTHWISSTILESLSDGKLMNPGETREPGVGQDDLACTGPGSMKGFDLRSKALDEADEEKVIVMDSPATTGMELTDHSYHFRPTGLYGDEMQCPETMGDSSGRRIHSQRLSSPSRLLEEMVSNNAIKELAQQKRPASFHSCHSEEERGKSSLINDQASAAEEVRGSSFPVEYDIKILSHTDDQLDSENGSQRPMEATLLSHPEQNGGQSVQPIFQDSHVSEEAKAQLKQTFLFLEDTEVLDNTVYRDRANLGRKRGHRAPATRPGGVLSESDGESWMFKDSTEPRVASAASDEEVPEEPRNRKSRSSPLTKGVKVPLFPGLSPSALKAKLRGRNRSSEEGDPQSEVKETQVQRSKSCKIASISGKPLVLPPKPEKTSGSETSSPNWLQVLKLKKKKS